MIGIRCPHCRNVLVFRELDPGDVRKCPKCKEWFAMPAPGAEGPRVCPRCRNEVASDAKMCVGCGFGGQPGEEFPPPPGAVVERKDERRRSVPKRVLAAIAILALLAVLVYVFREPIWQNADQALYKQAQRSDRPADYRRYLDVFPQGRHAEEARQRLDALEEEDRGLIEGMREADGGAPTDENE